MSTRIPVSALLALASLVLWSAPAHAQLTYGPMGKPSYIEVHGEMLRSFAGIDAPVGGSVEFGSFQNRYIAAGTILGVESPGRGPHGTGLPTSLFFGGGFSFHIPLGQHVLLIPSFNLGYSLVDSSSGIGGGIAAYGMLGAAYRFRRFYFGLEATRPIYLVLPGATSAFFPNLTTGGAFVGAYF